MIWRFWCRVTNIAGVRVAVQRPRVQLHYAHTDFSFHHKLARTLLTFNPALCVCVCPKHSPLRLSYSSGLFPSFFASKYSLQNHLWEWFCSYNIPISTFSWPTETSPPALMTPPPQFSIHTHTRNLSFSAPWHQPCFHPQPQPPDRSPLLRVGWVLRYPGPGSSYTRGSVVLREIKITEIDPGFLPCVEFSGLSFSLFSGFQSNPVSLLSSPNQLTLLLQQDWAATIASVYCMWLLFYFYCCL